MSNKNNDICDKIKRYRKLRNMSQEELASASGINISSIKKYEAGFRNPKTDQIAKIAEALNISINAFISFDISTVSDVISLLMNLDEQIDMTWTGEKDSYGNYIPDSISISFINEEINKCLATYLSYKNMVSNASNNEAHADTLNVEYSIPYEDGYITIDNTKSTLLLTDTPLKEQE